MFMFSVKTVYLKEAPIARLISSSLSERGLWQIRLRQIIEFLQDPLADLSAIVAWIQDVIVNFRASRVDFTISLW